MLIAAAVLALAQARNHCSGHSQLGDFTRAGIVRQLERDASVRLELDLLISPECWATVEGGLAGLGATVLFRDRRVGYIDAEVRADRAVAALSLGGIEAAGLARDYRVDDYTTQQERPQFSADSFSTRLPAGGIPIPQVAKSLETGGPYFPAREGGLESLRQAYPQADGRGTGIAVIDDGLDLLHPALLRVESADGRKIAKVVDLLTDSTPSSDYSWVTFSGELQPVRHRIQFAGRVWRVPADRPYRLGI